MMNLQQKENRVAGGLSPTGLKEHRFYTILQVILYVLAAFTFWEFLYELCNMIGSVVSGTPARAIVELKRVIPFILTMIMWVALTLIVFRARFAADAKERVRSWMAGGIFTWVMGALVILYIVIGLVTGQYARLVEGAPSPLFPLDVLLGGVLMLGIGCLSRRYGKGLKNGTDELGYTPCNKGGFRRVIEKILYTLVFLVSLCGFAAAFYAIYVMDWAHGNLFYNIMLWLNCFTVFAMVFVYRFVYSEAKEEAKPRIARTFGLGFAVINIALFALFLLSVELENEAPNLNAFGLLPITFTASFNAFMPIYGLTNLLPPIAALVKSFIPAGKK